ncbi:hypothetical protein M8J76_006194 [Diaphorina citri]|nr:hypothetical protein M8J76_006194 [Diaphorina citri]
MTQEQEIDLPGMTQEPEMDLDDSSSDWSLTKKLRVEDPEQFHTLVRMHLSFVLDLNTDETDSTSEEKSKFRPLKWSFTSFSKKMKNSKGVVEGEGVPLTEDLISQIYQLIDFLSLEPNITQEGIFRKSGSTSRQQELKNLLGQSNSIELSSGQFSVHDCASVLKCYLAELPEPVLTELYYPAYCQIADLCLDSEQSLSRLLRSIQLLLLLLPLDNYNLFKKLISLLHLTAKALHTSAAVLSKIVVFMIDNGSEIFLVPDTLATDVKAYWAKKERKLKSPVKDPVNDSIMDSSAVNTVFTFVDREKTAQSNSENSTEAALAQLYAYIQALPESSKKRRLVKQFNKENGHGTPAVVARQTPGTASSTGKHFGDSIKKHIFSKGIRNKLNNQTNSKAKKLLLDGFTSAGGSNRSTGDLIPPTLKQETRSVFGAPNRRMPDLSRLYEQWAESSDDDELCSPFFATPTPSSRSRLVVSRLNGGWGSGSPTNPRSERMSLSPITMSAQKMTRAMQETMLTPRSRKPVVALSGTNLCHLATFQSPLPLPSSNDDLLTATVDLSFTHDSLSDSMIKTLEDDAEDLFDNPAENVSPNRKQSEESEALDRIKKSIESDYASNRKQNLIEKFSPGEKISENEKHSTTDLPGKKIEDYLDRKQNTADADSVDGTPPSSRKRSSQNNNNDENDIKKCIRDTPLRLSETAL